ncbi:MAG: hypothetical protein AAFY60_07425, partial [Myxococcota bacterium]
MPIRRERVPHGEAPDLVGDMKRIGRLPLRVAKKFDGNSYRVRVRVWLVAARVAVADVRLRLRAQEMEKPMEDTRPLAATGHLFLRASGV